MSQLGAFALHHFYLLVFAATLVEQLGLPLPAAPLLLGAGALARSGEASAAGVVALYVLASSLAHQLWFQAGRTRGTAVLRLVCRISLEPDTCVRRTENLFAKYGAKLLLAAPFTPGLGMVAPPLAGLSGMKRSRFMPIDSAGALLWSSFLVGVGFLLGPQLTEVLEFLRRVAGSVTAGVLLALAGYLAWKLLERRAVLADLRVARITAHELKTLLEAGRVVVVDLRHQVEMDAQGTTVPGALRIAFEELESRHAEIPRDREIALFCT